MTTYQVSYTITTRGRDFGTRVTFHGIAAWADEKSPYDPYTLRVLRDSQGRAVTGPMVGEFKDWEVTPE